MRQPGASSQTLVISINSPESMETLETFNLPDWPNPVTVTVTGELTKEMLLSFDPFTEWLSRLQESFALQTQDEHPFRRSPYGLRSIKIHSVDYINGRILFLKLYAFVTNDLGESFPGIVLLMGEVVAMLCILQPKDNLDEKYIILCEQPRIAAASLSFTELPIGSMYGGEFQGVAAREIREELGIRFREEEVIDMTALVLESNTARETYLKPAMFLSAGITDQHVKLCLWERELERQEIEQLKAKTQSGVTMERIWIKIYNYDDLASIAGTDAKTLAAWTLYEELKRQGRI